MLTVKETTLQQVLLITPLTVHEDFRGSYLQTYNQAAYHQVGIPDFVQDDFCASYRNVLRGIHGDDHTWKLVHCPFGRIYQVVVNYDRESAQFLCWEAFFLSDANRLQVLVPPKFGNAYLVMSEWALYAYKQSSYYHGADTQFTLHYADPRIGIHWPIDNPILSERDRHAVFFNDSATRTESKSHPGDDS